jgi:carbonic anhydrase
MSYIIDIVNGMKAINEAYDADPFLREGQKPILAVTYCADSRVSIEKIYGVEPGVIFGNRNVGNSLEEPGNETELRFGALEHLVYGYHLGIRDFRVQGHEGCGAMNNAYNCNCGGHDAHGHDHGHADTIESKIIAKMGKNKEFAVKLVSEKEAPAYLSKLGMPVSGDAKKDHVRAITVAHAFYQRDLAEGILEQIAADYAKAYGQQAAAVTVGVDYLDLVSKPAVLYSYSKEDGRFYDASIKGPDRSAPGVKCGKDCGCN